METTLTRGENRPRPAATALVAFVLAALAVEAASPATSAAASEADRARGSRLFAQYCEGCHGRGGRGDGVDSALFEPPPPALTPALLRRRTTEALVAEIREGRPREVAMSPAALRARATDVEAIVAHLQRLPAIQWRTVERGAELFIDRCETCHGPFGRPEGRPPPGVGRPRDLSDPAFQRSVQDADLVDAVRHGRQGMPALMPRIAEEDARAIAAFVRVLSPGMERYTRYCAACHGDDGRGAGSLVETQRAPSVVFDQAYFARRDAEQLRAKAWHMLDESAPRMPHFRGRLTEADARAIVAYLLARE